MVCIVKVKDIDIIVEVKVSSDAKSVLSIVDWMKPINVMYYLSECSTF